MKQPQTFDFLLHTVMAIITIVFTVVSFFSYTTPGADTRTGTISNLPQDDKFINTVQFLYSLTVLVGTPSSYSRPSA